MSNNISNDKKLQVKELIDEMDIIVFEPIKEITRENRIIKTYIVSLFNDIRYLYDFFYYASKCYDKYFFNFVNENNEVVTKEFITNEFVLTTENIERICEENKLQLSITLYVNNKHMTISKQYGKDEIIVISTLDEKGLDLDRNIVPLMSNYLNWIQSEQIYGILKEALSNTKKVYLASGYLLIQYMLDLSDEEYNEFYNTNLKWLEKKVDTVSSDKKFWTALLEEIGKALIEKRAIKELSERMKYITTIDCFCGQEIEVDWREIPQTEKVVHIKCPICDGEIKAGNPLYIESEM